MTQSKQFRGRQFLLANSVTACKHGAMSNGMALIRAERGMLSKVAYGLGLTRAAVVRWEQVPAERVVDIERITGIPREALRPDLFRRPACACEAA